MPTTVGKKTGTVKGKQTRTVKKTAVKSKTRSEKPKTDKSAVNKHFKKGDILDSTWGYEQTNVDFYEVVDATEKTVILQKIGSKEERRKEWGHYDAMPDTKQKVGKPFRRKADGTWVSINSYAGARKWKGKPVDGTDYY